MNRFSFLDIPPLESASGTVRLPGSKSISNRFLLLAAMARGCTVMTDVLRSEDTAVMIQALQKLGCDIEQENTRVRVQGLGGQLSVQQADLFIGNAGTAARSLTAVLAVLATLQGGKFKLSGVSRMHERPIADLVEALQSLGCSIQYLGVPGYMPLQVGTGQAQTLRLQQAIAVRGNVSSQFLSGLLMALPLAAHSQAVTIEVQGELISKPYIAITLNCLRRFGVSVINENNVRFTIPPGSVLISPGEIMVEADASSASYFVGLGAIASPPDRPLRIEGIGEDSIQGDARFLEVARALGAQIKLQAQAVEVARGAWPLRALELDCNDIPDAAMTLAVLALYARGITRLSGIGSWRVKETDRLSAMAQELRKLGAGVVAGVDFIEITPPAVWQAAAIKTYDDHRMAMCFSLTAFNGLAHPRPGYPIRIEDPNCVAKTFPDYFATFFDVCQTPAHQIPVLTIDGPTASGKGTLASAVAKRLGYGALDSGSLYRVLAWVALQEQISSQAVQALAERARGLQLRFEQGRLLIEGRDVTDQLRDEEVASLASKIAAFPPVRSALVDLQLSFRRLPGLVADGRDMGTLIFPDARLKVFLTASAATRAQRRYQQLLEKGIFARLDDLRMDLQARDARDRTRAVAPLEPAADALLLDNSGLTIDESVDLVLDWWQQRSAFGCDQIPDEV